MPTMMINGIDLYYELSDGGDVPVVFVHGAWSWHNTWDSALQHMPDSFRILTYDRRGHAQSGRSPQQGIIENADDLAALITALDFAPAWLVGNSYGASVAMRMAGHHPQLVRGLIGHEPHLDDLVADIPALAPQLEAMNQGIDTVLELIAAGDNAAAAEQFMELIVGPGSWARFSPERQQIYIANAPAFVDVAREPFADTFDPDWLRSLGKPVLLTQGDQSGPFADAIFDQLNAMLPDAQFLTFPDAGHVPQITQPQVFAEAIAAFIHRHT
jgi:pimeloyl-ACP methyl ester carboxylesterase